MRWTSYNTSYTQHGKSWRLQAAQRELICAARIYFAPGLLFLWCVWKFILFSTSALQTQHGRSSLHVAGRVFCRGTDGGPRD
jgi:hypothetical protein